MKSIPVSTGFKRRSAIAVLAILFFIIAYFTVVAIALLLVAAAIGAGIFLVLRPINLIIVFFGIALVGSGLLVFYFLIKFIFNRQKEDRSNLTEIEESKFPKLFAFVREVAEEVGVPFPKRIYLSPDVNASAFYDSPIKSLFFPSKKNLHLGMGLINSVTVSELKAIIAHEFGHFSQRSMKVGVFVHQINYIIHQTLADDPKFDKVLIWWVQINSVFSLVANLAVGINNGIRWVLAQLYKVVNLAHMGLSREMEFHADAVAAEVAGSRSLEDALLRTDLAAYAFQRTLEYYGQNHGYNKKSENIYPEMHFVMKTLAEKNEIPVKGNLPVVQMKHIGRYDKSKLRINSQWESHPSNKDRISSLRKLAIEKPMDDRPATILIDALAPMQKELSVQLFGEVYQEAEDLIYNEFTQSYLSFENQFATPKPYLSYYDSRSPVFYENEDFPEDFDFNWSALFNPEKVDLVYSCYSLENDLQVIRDISLKIVRVSTFEYDGYMYKRKHAATLADRLKAELDVLKEKLNVNDRNIFFLFMKITREKGIYDEWLSAFKAFNEVEKKVTERIALLQKLQDSLNFIYETLPEHIIKLNLDVTRSIEEKIRPLLEDDIEGFRLEAQDVMMEEIRVYLKRKHWIYFSAGEYNMENLNVVFSMIQQYHSGLQRYHAKVKYDLLEMSLI
ncbi:MAG: M48 family metallopeptidase [Cryomorphaceae bacterium]|nr:M48 family metallopeptidase [Cryomorphaceae bacterium]